ncbi:ATP-binding protein [Kitasatospora sp. NPDC056076]|uniref:ATP-binding protein n=1 Tax=Kitasatospora sp. NPDC056076 TaxID=3345703 RepID=UPI0035DF8BB7
MQAVPDPGHRRSLSFPADQDGSLRRGREFTRRALAQWHLCAPHTRAPPLLAEDVLLVTSELLVNACLHGGGPRKMVVEHLPGAVRVAVSDTSPILPHRHRIEAGRPGGYGLLIVERLAVCWGATADTDGKTVWAQLLTTRPQWC